MMQNAYILKRIFILIILSYVFFIFGNSFLPLTDPDEVFYSLTAKEMAAKNEWMTPIIFDKPQFEKPIFTYWLLRFSFDQFGMTPFSARIFPALFAMFGVLGVYALGLIGFLNERKAFWSALILCTGALYAGMGKTVFTDMIFTVFILYSMLSFYLGFAHAKFRIAGTLGFFVFAGLATLTKGPLGVVMPAAAIILFLLYRGQIQYVLNRWVIVGVLIGAAIALPWYWLMIKLHGQAFLHEFFYNDHWRRLLEAEHRGNDRWYFYPLTMLMGLFPWTIFVGAAVVALFKRLKWGVSAFEYFMLSWILVVFVVFQSAHSKLASYILPLFPALALLTGAYLEELLAASTRSKLIRVALMIFCGFFTLLGIGVLALHGIYQKYVPEIGPSYLLSAMLLTVAGAVFTLLIKDRLRYALMVMGSCMLVFVWAAFIIRHDIEPFISSFGAVQYVPHPAGKPTVILTSKPYARGVRFYTGADVVVLDINGKNYFSPHPITILSTHDQLKEFLKKQPIIYAILKKGGYKEVTNNLPKEEFKVTLLKALGNNFVVSIEPVVGT